MHGASAFVIAAAAFLTALGVLVRVTHLHELGSGLLEVVRDWRGRPATSLAPAVPSLPTQVALLKVQNDTLDERTKQLHHQFAGEVVSRLQLLQVDVAEVKQKAVANNDALARLDQRVSDHRRRNEQQVQELRQEVHLRIRQLAGDVLRTETYRAALVELGFDTDLPHPPEELGE